MSATAEISDVTEYLNNLTVVHTMDGESQKRYQCDKKVICW